MSFTSELSNAAVKKYVSVSASAVTALPPINRKRGGGHSHGRKVVIDLQKIREMKYEDYNRFMSFTHPGYFRYAASPPGKEHYALLAYFAKVFNFSKQSFIDVGTRYATSALTLGSLGHAVDSYDTPLSTDFPFLMNELNTTKENWLMRLKESGGDFKFHSSYIMELARSDFEVVRTSPLILLDTEHLPFTQPFERLFMTYLIAAGYYGVMLLDDIYHNDQMTEWFIEVVCNYGRKFHAYDLTSVGHLTGTAMLDFSKRTIVLDTSSNTTQIQPILYSPAQCDENSVWVAKYLKKLRDEEKPCCEC